MEINVDRVCIIMIIFVHKQSNSCGVEIGPPEVAAGHLPCATWHYNYPGIMRLLMEQLLQALP